MPNTYTEDDRKEALKLAEEIGVTPASQRLGISDELPRGRDRGVSVLTGTLLLEK